MIDRQQEREQEHADILPISVNAMKGPDWASDRDARGGCRGAVGGAATPADPGAETAGRRSSIRADAAAAIRARDVGLAVRGAIAAEGLGHGG